MGLDRPLGHEITVRPHNVQRSGHGPHDLAMADAGQRFVLYLVDSRQHRDALSFFHSQLQPLKHRRERHRLERRPHLHRPLLPHHKELRLLPHEALLGLPALHHIHAPGLHPVRHTQLGPTLRNRRRRLRLVLLTIIIQHIRIRIHQYLVRNIHKPQLHRPTRNPPTTRVPTDNDNDNDNRTTSHNPLPRPNDRRRRLGTPPLPDRHRSPSHHLPNTTSARGTNRAIQCLIIIIGDGDGDGGTIERAGPPSRCRLARER